MDATELKRSGNVAWIHSPAMAIKNFWVVGTTFGFAGFLAGCGKSDSSAESSRSQKVQSFAEAATERSRAVERANAGAPPAQLDSALHGLLKDLSPRTAVPYALPESIDISTRDDEDSPVAARFRLPWDRAVQVHEALRDRDKSPAHSVRILQEAGRDICEAIFFEMNQLSNSLNFDLARAKLIPARRAWIISLDAQDQIAWDGVGGYFGNRNNEVLAAIAGFRFFGMSRHADALAAAVEHMPKEASGAIRWHEYPLPEETSEFVEKDFDLLIADGETARALNAMQRPELFFTRSADAFKPGRKETPAVPNSDK